MSLPVEWRPSARADLAAIIGFIAEHDSYAARGLKLRIELTAERLSMYPYLGPAGRVAGTRELLAHPNYWVVYRVTASAVEILSVLHAREQYP